MTSAHNPLRGEFAATLAGEAMRFDTTLASIATMEERCGGIAIVEAVNRAVFGRRAGDHQALVAGALIASGRDDAEALASRTSLAEAESFILALMGALGFSVARKAEGTRPPQAPAGSRHAPLSDAAVDERRERWTRWRAFALGALTWSEDTFWRCSWRGFADAWTGYCRFVLGVEPGREGLTRHEAEALDDTLRAWQRQEQPQDRRS